MNDKFFLTIILYGGEDTCFEKSTVTSLLRTGTDRPVGTRIYEWMR